MVANIESYAGRQAVWHGLGYVFGEDESSDLDTMLDKANLANWNVRLHPLTAEVDGVSIPVDGKNVVLRDHPLEQDEDGNPIVDALGVVGDRYRAYQNEETFAFAEAMVDQGAQWETAGSLDGGRKVFGSFLLPKDIVLDPTGAADTVRLYLLTANSHDGTMPFTGLATGVRVVCQNTLNMAVAGAKQSFRLRHTAKLEGRVQDARLAIGMTFAYADALEAEAKALYETAMTNAQFSKLVESIYPKPDVESKGAVTRWENKVDLIGDIWNGKTTENIAGTAWGALNALTERIDWYRKPRGGDGTTILEATAGFNPAIQQEKNDLRKRVLEFVS